MIYDFACLGQPLVQKILAAMPGAVAVFAVIAGISVLGRFLNCSTRFQAEDIFSGWGFAAAILTLTGLFFTKALPFAVLALFILIAVAAVPAFRRRYFISPFWLLALFPGLFILTALNSAGVAKWDDFSHWALHALYLFHNDTIAGAGMPQAYAVCPGYPYALPFLTYMASWLSNGFLMQGGAMANFLLLIAFAFMLAETKLRPAGNAQAMPATIGKTALALLLVTLANPAFNASFTMTNQGDTSTMVLTAALGIMLWRMIGKPPARAQIIAAALTAVALILVKQSNIVLLFLLVLGFLITAMKNRILKSSAIPAMAVFLPAAAFYMIWQHHVSADLGGDCVTLRPLGAWRFDLLGPILKAVGLAMLKKNGFSILMLATGIYGAIGLFRKPTPLRNFALIAGIVYAGFWCFLVITYMGATFTETEIRRAASFYRYMTHTGLLGITALWLAAPEIWNRVKGKIRLPQFITRPAARMFLILFAIALLPIAFFVHAEWLVPQPSPELCTARAFGDRVAEHLPPQSRLAVFDSNGDGTEPFITNFELALDDARTGHQSHVIGYTDRAEPERQPLLLQRTKKETDINAVLLTRPDDELKKFFGLRGNEPQTLLIQGRKGWQAMNLPSH